MPYLEGADGADAFHHRVARRRQIDIAAWNRIDYKADMKRSPLIIAIVCGLIVICGAAFGAGPANFAGEYADKKFLNGQGVFQMSLEQNGKTVSVFFSAAHNDGSGAAPEADGTGKTTPKGSVEFKWEDSLKNAGTGTITRAGSDMIVSLKTTRVADARCLEFYRQTIQLKPAGKK